jgi:hypothetical protein
MKQPRRFIEVRPKQDSMSGTLKALAEATPDKPKHGGKRQPCCPDHPDAGTFEQRVIRCAAPDCGRVLEPQPLYVQDGRIEQQHLYGLTPNVHVVRIGGTGRADSVRAPP